MAVDNVDQTEATVRADITEFNFDIEENESYIDANIRLVKELERGILSLKYDQMPKQIELNTFVEEVTELFFEKYGKFPNNFAMNKLTNVCVLYFIKSKSTTKLHEPNAFHTDRQIKSRNKREKAGFQDGTLDYLQNKRMNPDNYSRVRTKHPQI